MRPATAVIRVVVFSAIALCAVSYVGAQTDTAAESHGPRTDGIYFFPAPGVGGDYLRFFQDGSVIAATIFEPPDAVATNFGPDAAELVGAYVITSPSTVEFVTASEEFTVESEAEVLADGLVVRSHSLTNGFRAEREYTFVPF